MYNAPADKRKAHSLYQAGLVPCENLDQHYDTKAVNIGLYSQAHSTYDSYLHTEQMLLAIRQHKLHFFQHKFRTHQESGLIQAHGIIQGVLCVVKWKR